MKKILVSKFNLIGDVLISTVLIRNLKMHYPSAKITFATYKFNEDILKGNSDIDELILFDKTKKNLLSKIVHELNFFLTILRKRHDIYLCLRDCSRGRYLGLLTGARKRVSHFSKDAWCYTDVTRSESLHAVERDLSVLKALDLPIVNKKMYAHWSEKDVTALYELLPQSKFVQIHPVARWKYKEIQLKVVCQLAERIFQLGYQVVFTCSPDPQELQKIKEVTEMLSCPYIHLGGKISLPQLAYVSKKAELFVGCDTAAMHIATSVETPVIAWFGPSLTENWGPWDPNEVNSPYLNHGGGQAMGYHQVIQLNKDCIPCDQKGCQHSGKSDCLEEMQLEDIWPAIKKKLVT